MYLKLFWLTFVSVWRVIVGGEAKEQVTFEILMDMISELSFPDWLIRREFFRFCQLDKIEWRLSHLLDKIAEQRPKLFQDLETTLDRTAS